MGYFTSKDEQLRIIVYVLGGRDVFVRLPTGYGKSLCYAVLPWVFDELSRTRKDNKHSIVLVVSPLVSLTADQVGLYAYNEFLSYDTFVSLVGCEVFIHRFECRGSLR